jgi:hypothetical protein
MRACIPTFDVSEIDAAFENEVLGLSFLSIGETTSQNISDQVSSH